MLRVNCQKIEQKHFPDGTQMLLDIDVTPYKDEFINFYWRYENDEELVTLQFLSMHYKDLYPSVKQILYMGYIPNARMDRVKSNKEVFTLKYFAKIINSLGFDEVTVLDPHSDVSVALLDHVRKIDVGAFINMTIRSIKNKENTVPVLYFPDAGAMKRYKGIIDTTGMDICYGEKVRDWSTGVIKGLEVKVEGDFTLENRVVLMIDDIVAFGGTLAYSADKLNELGASKIYAYVTHTENSVLDKEKGTLLKRLNDGIVAHLFTTHSIYNGEHPSITSIIDGNVSNF